MTIHEAIEQLESLLGHCQTMRESGEVWVRDCEALRIAIATLRGPTREQVEAWKGEWEWYDEEIGSPLEGVEREWGWRCSKCKVVLPDDFDDPDNPPAMRFCPSCGVALTDEAVEITLRRLEDLDENRTD